MAATIITDTLALTKRLTSAGMPVEQAEALAGGLNAHAADVATKQDLRENALNLKLWFLASQLASTVTIIGVIAKAHGWL